MELCRDESINIRPAKNFAYIKNKSVRPSFIARPITLSFQFGLNKRSIILSTSEREWNPAAGATHLLASTSCACLHPFLLYFRLRRIISPLGKYINYSYLPSIVLSLIVFSTLGECVASWLI